jgi:hypothetical protein
VYIFDPDQATSSRGFVEVACWSGQVGAGFGVGVVVAVLAGVQDAGDGLQGGLGDLDLDGRLPVSLDHKPTSWIHGTDVDLVTPSLGV